MKKVKLGEVCEIVTGSTPKSTNPDYWNGEYKWITPAEISDDDFIIVDTQRKISKLGIEKTGLKSFPIGTVLLSSRAPIGKVAIAGCEMYCNQGFKNFICSNEINNEYLYYFLKSRKNFLNNIGRGATFKEISKSIISNIEIILPSYDVQCTQTQNLKKIDNLIYLRKKVIKEYQLLVKSRFNEMFGDPINNDKKFAEKTGQQCFKFSSGKFLDKNDRVFKGYPAYGGNGIAWKSRNYLIDNPTIIIGRVGAYCGNVRTTHGKVWISDNAIYIKEFKNLDFNLVFLLELMKVIDFSRFADFSGQPKITQKPLEKQKYILPPLSLQNEFADFVAQVDKSQLAIQKSLEELETLKKSLMQEYFG